MRLKARKSRGMAMAVKRSLRDRSVCLSACSTAILNLPAPSTSSCIISLCVRRKSGMEKGLKRASCEYAANAFLTSSISLGLPTTRRPLMTSATCSSDSVLFSIASEACTERIWRSLRSRIRTLGAIDGKSAEIFALRFTILSVIS